jgi:mono/diheme cytochrome c family protein
MPRLSLLAALLTAGWSLTLIESRPGEPTPADPAREFTASVRPVLRAYCAECHGADQQEGGVSFDLTAADVPKQRPLWQRAALRVRAREMPPAEAKPLPPAEREQLLAWLLRGKTGFATEERR